VQPNVSAVSSELESPAQNPGVKTPGHSQPPLRRENSAHPDVRVESVNHSTPTTSDSLSSPKGGLELLGKQRKEFAGGEGPQRAERAGASESLGRGEEVVRVHREEKYPARSFRRPLRVTNPQTQSISQRPS
jgi:hypothetical protein